MNTIVPMKRIVTPSDMQVSGGTWTLANFGAGRMRQTRTAGTAGQAFITVPVRLERPENQYGARIRSIALVYRLNTASGTASSTITYYRLNNGNPFSATPTDIDQTIVGGNTVTFSRDSGATANAAQQFVTLTPNTLAWENEVGAIPDQEFSMQLTINCDTATTLEIYPATIHYDVQFG